MKRRDLHVGAKVYHCLLWNWGEGEVVETRDKDNLGCPTWDRYRVRWRDGRLIWSRAKELRKTPKVPC